MTKPKTSNIIRYGLTFAAIFFLLCACAKQDGFPAAPEEEKDMFEAPFGWAVCNSLTTSGDFNLTGGGDGTRIILKSNGEDMKDAVSTAIKNYDVIVLDGSNGDFLLSEAINLTGVDYKTIFGINNAVLKSIFYITPEMKKDFDAIDVENTGSETLNPPIKDVNGISCNTMRAYNYNNIIAKYRPDDTKEKWANSGAFTLNGCKNWIIRNITMTGPGSISSSHTIDVVTLSKGCKHIWVDHCTISDGADGNFDINTESDFITVSNCKFDYTERSYGHRLCSLIGANVNDKDQGHLNVTFARCCWAANGDYGVARQPMVRYGHVHVFNCYYPVKKGGTLMHARDGSNMLVEGNYFENVSSFFSSDLSDNYIVRNNHYNGDPAEKRKGDVTIPYKYTIVPATDVPALVQGKAGATLNLKNNDLF